MPSSTTNVEQLEQRLGTECSSLRAARELAHDKRSQLRSALSEYDSSDTAIVVSGSLARNEFTARSDSDWTLLVDGVSDPAHHELTRRIGIVVRALAAKQTVAEGKFGSLVFADDLGGEDDTNCNTTRHLLLLLESAPVGRDDAYRRAVRNILYLLGDSGWARSIVFRDFCRTISHAIGGQWRLISLTSIGSYENFVAILPNDDLRKHLEKLNEDAAGTDTVCQHARHLSHEFRDGLLELFFDAQSGMDTLTRNYGVF